ncbi:Flavodoxin-like fold family protein [Histomonas meleagridis]|uniref:Flavodoxin-like fold family protein n=1 Tax=Histomonas meleagridis TaxID=135588 RepID=UPI00355AB9FF|nr:Flavodoxin-like fold family protein [Histomonas meleagridis]KAH0796950.1 Flavodoxin-like fold family protein [Histomonas meleagridis]
MKYLIIIAHCDPNKNATAYRIANCAKESLLTANHEVKITDLISEGFDRVATMNDFKTIPDRNKFNYIRCQLPVENLCDEIRRQQELIKWCDHVIVFGAMFFYRFPACLYAWIDRCFTLEFGFANSNTMDNGLLKGKKASFIITTAGSESHFLSSGYSPLESLLYSTTYGLRYCGIECTRSMGYFTANKPGTVDKEVEWIEKFKKAILKIDSWPLLPVLRGKPKDGEKNEAEIFAQLDPLRFEEILYE